MFSQQKSAEFYKALVEKDANYEGVFYAGIKTTGIFCRPTCTARKPKPENCEFYKDVQSALLAGYRACKVCKPLSVPGEMSDLVKKLVSEVENNPEKRWKDEDFRKIGVDKSTARRQFQKRFGMTFVAYARARRMGLALGQIKQGQKVIEAQLDAGYESGSGFRDAFSRIMGAAPTKGKQHTLCAEWIDTKLGPMIAMADDNALWLLEFTDRRGLEREIERMRKTQKIAIVPGRNAVIAQIEQELEAYFSGELKTFKTPLKLVGTSFQKGAWEELIKIPYGETVSYSKQAEKIGNLKAVRAVARANGCNQLAIIIPCHRVVGADGALTGYAGGLPRKKWLLEHERANA